MYNRMIISEDIPTASPPSAVALGYFDGVHIGHQAVINAAVNCSSSVLIPTVFTFKNSPSAVISGNEPTLITTASQKHSMLESLGVKRLYEVDFESICRLTPDEFVEKILKDALNAKEVFCGFNYKFGAGRCGDFNTLSSICEKHGIKAHCVEPVYYLDKPVSSTRIRNALTTGNISDANKMLGRCFSLSLPISEGNKIGRTLGFPTLNQILPENLIKPRFGVYASVYINQGNHMCAVTNIGIKPTVGNSVPLAETWVMNVDLNSLYGKTAEIALLDFIRDEQRFSDLPLLKEAVFKDGKRATEIYLKALSDNRIKY